MISLSSFVRFHAQRAPQRPAIHYAEAAIGYAADGFPLTQKVSAMLKGERAFLETYPATAAVLTGANSSSWITTAAPRLSQPRRARRPRGTSIPTRRSGG